MRNSLVALGSFMILSGSAWATPPERVNYQALLTDLQGEPLAGVVTIEIGIFDQATNGAELYHEIHVGVPLQQGVFNISLGDGATTQGNEKNCPDSPFAWR